MFHGSSLFCVCDREDQIGLRGDLTVDPCGSLSDSDRTLLFDQLTGEFDDIAGDDLPFEPCTLHTPEQCEFPAVFRKRERGDRPGLGERFQEKHTGHDRISGKMSLKKGFVDCDTFDSLRPFSRLEIRDPVDERKRVPVRKNFRDLCCVERVGNSFFVLILLFHKLSSSVLSYDGLCHRLIKIIVESAGGFPDGSAAR